MLVWKEYILPMAFGFMCMLAPTLEKLRFIVAGDIKDAYFLNLCDNIRTLDIEAESVGISCQSWKTMSRTLECLKIVTNARVSIPVPLPALKRLRIAHSAEIWLAGLCALSPEPVEDMAADASSLEIIHFDHIGNDGSSRAAAWVSALAHLTTLSTVSLRHTMLSFVPDELMGLGHIQHIDLSFNALSSYDQEGTFHDDVFESIENLLRLETLVLAHNLLTNHCFEGLRRLKTRALRTLDISHNPGTELPLDAECMCSLEKLIVTVLPSDPCLRNVELVVSGR